MGKRVYRKYALRLARKCAIRAVVEGEGVANDRVVKSMLSHYGFRLSGDDVRKLLDWLEAQGFVTLEDLPEGIVRIEATEKGIDLAHDRVTHPEVSSRTDDTL